MSRKALNMRLPGELIARVDAEADRLGQTRTKFIERALESALDNAGTNAPRGSERVAISPASDHSVSSRAPVEKEPDSTLSERELGPCFVEGCRCPHPHPKESSPQSASSRPALKDTWAR